MEKLVCNSPYVQFYLLFSQGFYLVSVALGMVYFFPSFFYFNLVLSLDLNYVSCKQHMVGFCFCIQSGNLCLLIEVFRTFTFNVIIDRIMSNYFDIGFLFSFSISLRVHWIVVTILFYLLLANSSSLSLFQQMLWGLYYTFLTYPSLVLSLNNKILLHV